MKILLIEQVGSLGNLPANHKKLMRVKFGSRMGRVSYGADLGSRYADDAARDRPLVWPVSSEGK